MLPEIYLKSLYTDTLKPWRFELTRPLKIVLSNNQIIYIPQGYKTDFASVPRLLRGLVSTIGKHNLAVLIHDYLYDKRYENRKFADKEMLHWLRKSGVSKVKSFAMYFAVRIAGKSWWEK